MWNSTGIRLEFDWNSGGSIHSTCLHAIIIKVKNPQRPLVNILSIFGGENSLRKKGVGGKRENLEEGEIARQRTGWTDVWHARIRVRHLFTLPYSPFPPTSAVYPPPLLCPLLIISSLFTTPFFLREFSPSRNREKSQRGRDRVGSGVCPEPPRPMIITTQSARITRNAQTRKCKHFLGHVDSQHSHGLGAFFGHVHFLRCVRVPHYRLYEACQFGIGDGGDKRVDGV